jgi:Ca2+-binding EF-hand superfamily protein
MFRKAKNAIATQKALRSMGPSSNTKVSQSDFLEICRQLHNRRRETFWNNAGFSAEEVNSMKQQFFDFDNDHNGYISSEELGVMLQNVFPNMCCSAELRPCLLKVLQEVAVSEKENGEGLDFPDFLRIMRSFVDLLEKDPVAREEDVITQCGFKRHEVEEFRELFSMGDGVRGDGGEYEEALEKRTTMGLVDFIRMVERVAPLSAAELQQLRKLYKDIVELGAGLRIAGFPEFLLLMRRLVDMNFADIKNIILASDDNSKSGQVTTYAALDV